MYVSFSLMNLTMLQIWSVINVSILAYFPQSTLAHSFLIQTIQCDVEDWFLQVFTMKDYYVSILVKVSCGLPHTHQLFVLFFNSLGRGNMDISMQFPVYLLFNYCHNKLQLIYTTYVWCWLIKVAMPKFPVHLNAKKLSTMMYSYYSLGLWAWYFYP